MCGNSAVIPLRTEGMHTMTTLLWPLVRRASQRHATPWHIRRVHGLDVGAMQRFVDALNPGNRRWRFHGAVKACSARLAAMLVEGDAVWAAFHGDVLIGEARFVRDSADPEKAELAMAVADAWHGSGVAAALLATLLAEADGAGVRLLLADVMCGNARMQRFLQRHGFAPRLQWDSAGDIDVFERRLLPPSPWQRLAATLRRRAAAAPPPIVGGWPLPA